MPEGVGVLIVAAVLASFLRLGHRRGARHGRILDGRRLLEKGAGIWRRPRFLG
jgi:hypothetical protein